MTHQVEASTESQSEHGFIDLCSSENSIAAGSEQSSGKKRVIDTIICVVLFCLAIAISLRQNWQPDVASTSMIYDAGHYEVTVQLIVAQVLEGMHRLQPHDAASLGLSPAELAPHLLLDGPLLPLLGSILWVVLGHIPTAAEWRTFVLLESSCHAISTVLMFLLAKRLQRKVETRQVPSMALLPAVIWMFYPSAVIGSGTFMTEVPTASFLLLAVYSSVRILETMKDQTTRPSLAPALWSVTLGVCVGLLFVSKQALAPGLVLVSLMLLVGTVRRFSASTRAFASRLRRALVLLSPAVIVFVAIVASWASFCYMHTGHAYLGAYRVPTFNVVKGTEPTADGWGTFPQTPVAMQYPETVSPGKAFAEIWKNYPADCLNLYARKPERLWGLPWNDYHYKYFGMPISLQIWWHRLLVIFGCLGAAVFLDSAKLMNPSARFVGWSSLFLIAAHAIFVPFETMSRYAFTTMPFIVLLACTPLALVWQRDSKERLALNARAAASLVLFAIGANVCLLACQPETVSMVAQFCEGPAAVQWTTCLCVISAFAMAGVLSLRLVGGWARTLPCLGLVLISVVAWAHVAHRDEIREWAAQLKPGNKVMRRLPLDCRSPDWALVLIDGDKHAENAIVSVNGRILADKPKSLFLFNTERAVMLDGLQLWARLCRQPLEATRQWRAVQVPPSLLHCGINEENTVSLEPGADAPVTIYGDYLSPAGEVSLPSLKYLSGGRSLHEIQSMDMRTSEHGTAFKPAGTSLYVSPGKSKTLDHTRMNGQSLADLSPSPGRQFGQYRLYLLLGYRHQNGQSAIGAESSMPDATAPGARQRLNPEPFVLQIPESRQVSRLGLSQPIQLPATMSKPEQERIELQVSAGELSRAGVFAGQFLIQGSGGEKIFLPGEPLAFTQSAATDTKSIAVEIPTKAFPAGISTIQFTLSSTNPSFVLHNAMLKVTPINLPLFSQHDIDIH